MTFRIRWQARYGGPFQQTLIEAPDKEAAEAILRRDYTVRRITRIAIRCEAVVVHEDGTRKSKYEPIRHRCRRFSQGRICPSHARSGG